MQTRAFEARVEASPDDVWAALTDPEVTRRFFFGLSGRERLASRFTDRLPRPGAASDKR